MSLCSKQSSLISSYKLPFGGKPKARWSISIAIINQSGPTWQMVQICTVVLQVKLQINVSSTRQKRFILFGPKWAKKSFVQINHRAIETKLVFTFVKTRKQQLQFAGMEHFSRKKLLFLQSAVVRKPNGMANKHPKVF